MDTDRAVLEEAVIEAETEYQADAIIILQSSAYLVHPELMEVQYVPEIMN